jgi:hypothetical protein
MSGVIFMRLLKAALLGLAATTIATSANAIVLYSNNFDSPEVRDAGVLGAFSGLPTDAASAGPWNADGWAGNYGRADNTSFNGLHLTGLASHTMISANFILGFLESWDSYNGGCCAPDNLEIWIDGTQVANLTYNNAFQGAIEDTDGNPVLYEYVQANGNTGFSDTLVDYSLTFAHTGSTLDFEFRASGAGWQGGNDEAYGIDRVAFTYNGVHAPAIPEPATWALMISGFGLAGATLRRRRVLTA